MTKPERLQAERLAVAPMIVHGFFTRRGGASTGVYASLNCGPGSGDRRLAVDANREAAMGSLGLEPGALATLHQIHSADVVTIAAPPGDGAAPKADAMVTDRPGIALGVLTADCAPVLLADPEAGVIAACHAGWRGAHKGVIGATIAAMRSLGADPARIAAAIGPCIGFASYEVDADFAKCFLDLDRDFDRYFAAGREPGKRLFDLAGLVEHQLRQHSVVGIGRIEADTMADPERFFSYRRGRLAGEADYGRQLSAIALTPDRAK
jgi:YfiH family protein